MNVRLEKEIISAELQFLLHLFSTDTNRSSCDPFDFEKLFELIKRHQVIASLSAVLGEIKASITENEAEKLFEEVNGAVFRQLTQTKGLLNLLREFNNSGIEVISFKGPLLSHELYGSFGLKSSNDLDLLVHPEQLLQSERLLMKLGYKPENYLFNNYSRIKWVIFKRFNYHGGYSHENGVRAELHWKFFASSKSFPKTTDEVFRDVESRLINNMPFWHLPKEDLIIYLSLHGTVHLWVRLKWLLDIRGFMIKYAEDMDWYKVLEQSEKARVTRAVVLAIYLSHNLFSTPLPDIFRDKLDDTCLIKLYDMSISRITGGFSPASRVKFLKVMSLVKGGFWKAPSYKIYLIPYYISGPFRKIFRKKEEP